MPYNKTMNPVLKADKDSPLQIVVVDDSSFTRKGVTASLEKYGYNVIGQCESAEAAIQKLNSSDVNLFVVDIVMPDVSGLEFARQVNESSMNTKILIMSSLNMEGVVVEAISSGAAGFIPKPFTEEDLIQEVKKVEQEFLKDG